MTASDKRIRLRSFDRPGCALRSGWAVDRKIFRRTFFPGVAGSVPDVFDLFFFARRKRRRDAGLRQIFIVRQIFEIDGRRLLRVRQIDDRRHDFDVVPVDRVIVVLIFDLLPVIRRRVAQVIKLQIGDDERRRTSAQLPRNYGDRIFGASGLFLSLLSILMMPARTSGLFGRLDLPFSIDAPSPWIFVTLFSVLSIGSLFFSWQWLRCRVIFAGVTAGDALETEAQAVGFGALVEIKIEISGRPLARAFFDVFELCRRR